MAKLLRLKLENYRNLANLEINLAGKDGKFCGQNRIGKTNCIEAICYLLTDKLLGGSADIASIKNQREPRLKVVVEGTFLTEEGEVTLRKEFYEKWVRPRGSATEELQGHSTDYFVNGAKQSRASDFFDLLEKKFGVPQKLGKLDAYQLVIDPFYLGGYICTGKDWKFAREAVIDIVGDVEPIEIYNANPDTEYAKYDLERHQYDDAETKKAIRGEISGYEKQFASNEALINEHGKTEDVPEEEYQSAKARDEEITAQMAKLKDGAENPYANEVTALQNELYALQTEYNKVAYAPADHSKSDRITLNLMSKRQELNNLEIQKKSIASDISRANQELMVKRSMQETYKKALVDLGEQAKAIMVEDVCPTCGQKLPEDKVQEAFNKKKAEIAAKAQEIRESALANKKSIESATELVQRLMAENLDDAITKLKIQISSAEEELQKAKAEEFAAVKKPDPKIQARIGEINDRLQIIRGYQAKGAEGLREQLADLKAEREVIQTTLARRIAYEHAQKRLAEIRAENNAIGKKQADAEQRLWAVGEFIKTKLELLDKHMAEKLGEVRFQLIKENIKAGSYDEVCVPYIINTVTGKHTQTLFPDGSKSEQIFTGIQIIRAIRNAKGWNPLPVLFDQGGELDNESTQRVSYEAEAQIIAVKVEGTATKPTFVPFNN